MSKQIKSCQIKSSQVKSNRVKCIEDEDDVGVTIGTNVGDTGDKVAAAVEIGRASCRERVCR